MAPAGKPRRPNPLGLRYAELIGELFVHDGAPSQNMPSMFT
jgi:hypothetical protein